MVTLGGGGGDGVAGGTGGLGTLGVLGGCKGNWGPQGYEGYVGVWGRGLGVTGGTGRAWGHWVAWGQQGNGTGGWGHRGQTGKAGGSGLWGGGWGYWGCTGKWGGSGRHRGVGGTGWLRTVRKVRRKMWGLGAPGGSEGSGKGEAGGTVGLGSAGTPGVARTWGGDHKGAGGGGDDAGQSREPWGTWGGSRGSPQPPPVCAGQDPHYAQAGGSWRKGGALPGVAGTPTPPSPSTWVPEGIVCPCPEGAVPPVALEAGVTKALAVGTVCRG